MAKRSAHKERHAFVVGWPIAHSRSPALHGAWLKEHDLAGSYTAQAIAPEDFDDFLRGLPASRFCGGNVTLPHKHRAFELVDEADEVARRLSAVNTVWLDGDRVIGSNTDAYGFAANLDDRAPNWRDGNTAVVIGAGGASGAIVFALLDAGYRRVWVLNRTQQRARELAERFGDACTPGSPQMAARLSGEADLLVNTSSLGMVGQGDLDIDLSQARPSLIVTDIVYTPLRTSLLRRAEQAGLTTVDGLGMLLHQAVPGFERWFGIRPTVTEELRRIVLGSDQDDHSQAAS